MKKLEIYKCSICGNIVELEHVGGGPLSCCGQPMILQKTESTDGALEKHVPVIEKNGNEYTIRVGSIPHPMIDVHYIEWIEIITENATYRKFLKPGDEPKATFKNIDSDTFIVREYCNIHGLYKSEQK